MSAALKRPYSGAKSKACSSPSKTWSSKCEPAPFNDSHMRTLSSRERRLVVESHDGHPTRSSFRRYRRPQSTRSTPYRLTVRVSGSRPWEHRGPVVQLGVHAALSRRRSRVQIPSGPLDTRKGDEEVE